MKKRAVSTSSIGNERDGRGTNMRLEKFVGLLRRPFWLTGLAVTAVHHDPRSVPYQNDDVHPEAQRAINSSSPVIAVKSPSFYQPASRRTAKRKEAGTSPKTGSPRQARRGYVDRCKANGDEFLRDNPAGLFVLRMRHSRCYFSECRVRYDIVES